MTAPEVREWTTYWDPRGKRSLGEGDSWVHSFYWGNEEERKKLLKLVLRETSRVKFAGHIEREGVAFFQAAKAQRLEGIVAKHRRSRYESGHRAATWLKVKIRAEQELVVGGWTPERSRPSELGALVVGVHEGGRLRFAGKVGSGFSGRTRRQLAELRDLGNPRRARRRAHDRRQQS